MSPGAQPLQPVRSIFDVRVGLRTRPVVTPIDPSPHPPILGSRSIPWPDEAACAVFAARIATHAELRDAVIELHGTLAAGKTTFTRHLLRALGVPGRIKSPSYSVVETYTLADGTAASHFDFYRFDDPREWVDAGLRDIFAAPGLKIVEWPDKAAGLLPRPDLRLRIELVGDGGRQVEADALTPRGAALLA
jgi:tRNA threonylcarbamoyladenosine biosynthesis protein TsaE